MITGHGTKMTQSWERCISALLSESSVKLAAHEAGVSESTLRTYLKDPDFREAYDDARRELLRLTIGRLHRASGAAVSTLVRKLRSPNDSTAVRAAVAILEQATKGADLLDVLTRLEALEQGAAERTTQWGSPPASRA